MILAGFPETMVCDGTSRVKTALAPMIDFRPTVTPARMIALRSYPGAVLNLDGGANIFWKVLCHELSLVEPGMDQHVSC